MSADALPIWTVYEHPSDMPDKYVARMFLCTKYAIATDEVIVADTLDEVRKTLACRGLIRITRHQTDDPVIVETWL